MTGSGLQIFPDEREIHPDVREVLPDVREWSGCPPGFLEVVRRPSRMSGSGLEDLLDVREWSECPPG